MVLGDIVEIKFGDRVPADVRVISSHGFKVSLFVLGQDSIKYDRRFYPPPTPPCLRHVRTLPSANALIRISHNVQQSERALNQYST